MSENYPESLLYTKEHEWCRVEGDLAIVGITWHAQNALGDVVFCELPESGSKLTQGQMFGVVESVKAVSELYAPLSGEVIERNAAVIEAPDVLNRDTYDKGWMLKIRITEKAELKGLLSQKDYEKLLAESA